MDERVQRVIEEFVKRLKHVHSEAKVEVQDFKWSTEDVNMDVWIPPITDEEEEADFHEKVSELTGDLFEETSIYILALVRSTDAAEV